MSTLKGFEVIPSPTRCKQCPIRQRALFKVVPKDYIDDAQRYRTGQYQLKARRRLYEEGDPTTHAYTLFDGWMLLYQTHSDGGRQGLRVALPGDFIGYVPLDVTTMSHSAMAITDVTLCAFKQQDLHNMLADSHELTSHVSSIHVRYINECQKAMLGLGRKSAEQRIAHLIVELFHRLAGRGDACAETGVMPFPLTQEMLGDLTGLTPVHTNRVMRKLREEGLLSCERQQLQVLDLERLTERGEYKGLHIA